MARPGAIMEGTRLTIQRLDKQVDHYEVKQTLNNFVLEMKKKKHLTLYQLFRFQFEHQAHLIVLLNSIMK